MKIDPLKRYCRCGHSWYFSKIDYIRMIIFGGLSMRCPVCNRKHDFILVYHAVEEFKETNIENKELFKRKKEVWKNG